MTDRRRVAVGLAAACAVGFAALALVLGAELTARLTVAGVVLGSIYALSGIGLVITYRASGVFNFAHGAAAMFVAYLAWQLSQWGAPVVVAALVAVFAIAPAVGVGLHRFVFSPLKRARKSEVDQLVASVGVFVLLLGLAAAVWGFESRAAPSIFGTARLTLPGNVSVTTDQVGIVVTVALVAGALYWFLDRTIAGLRLRAVVENRDLAGLFGVDVDRIAATGWAIGFATAGLTGVLLVPTTFGLNPYDLTLLVVETFAVAVIARFASLPLAAAGGVVLGLAVSFATQLRVGDLLASAGAADELAASVDAWTRPFLASLPVVALFVGIGVHRRFPRSGRASAQLDRVSAATGASPGTGWERRVPLIAADGAIVAVLLLAPHVLDVRELALLHEMVPLAIVLLSIVLLTGTAGHVSLGQAGFAGLGAFLTGRLIAGSLFLPPLPPLIAMAAAAVVSAAVGALVGYSALRRHVVLVALVTFSAALLLERLVFANHDLIAGVDTLAFDRPAPLGASLASPEAFHYALLVTLGAAIGAVVASRSGKFGRALRALGDSERAARSVGIRPRRVTLAVFALSSALAAMGGAGAVLNEQAYAPEEFRALNGVVWFAAVVVAGVHSVHGALLAAFALTVLAAAAGGGVITFLIGVGAAAIARLPGGLVPGFVALLRLGPPASTRLPGRNSAMRPTGVVVRRRPV